MTDRTKVSSRRRRRGALLAAALLSLLLPASALADPPSTTIDTGPDDGETIANNQPTFTFSTDLGTSFECRVDGPPALFEPCSDGDSHTTAQLADGTHLFEVRAVLLLAPDDTPATRSFTVDTTPPETTIESGPAEGSTINTRTRTLTFSSTEDGSSFECRLDDEAFRACSGPGDADTLNNLDDGPHIFRVQATDSLSNTDQSPATRSFTVDATPPNTTIDSGPTGTTSDSTPTFTFSSTETGSSFECRIGNGPFGACSGPGRSHTPASLPDGFHTFEVRATDPASNTDQSPASQAFAVDSTQPPDTTPPDLKITKRPKGKIKTKKKMARAAVSFSSEPGATFRCKLDRGEYKPCTSPYRVKAKAGAGKGKKHTISVRAADEAGNISKPAVIKLKVLRKLTLRAPVAHRTVLTALKRHDYARRVVRSVDVDCSRRSRIVFACKFSTRFSGYRLKGKGKVKLGNDLSYRFRVIAQGVHFTLTDENERPKR